ncbi:MAG: hypothetical protein QF902_07220 [Rhodospirillales bacterium]|jgi:hypothetical protein|nr:hypothetical protein [Rhodospirillales bacterium]
MRSWITAAGLLLGLAGFVHPALAEPQSLLLVAAGDVELVCDGAECAADATTLCLQPDRDVPKKGTAYEVMREAGTPPALALIGVQADGREIVLPDIVPIGITAERRFLAVRLAVAADVRARFGLAGLKVRVRESVMLVPATEAGDEAAMARLGETLRALRPVAETYLARNAEHVAAARMTHDVVNALPRERFVTYDELEAAWRQATAARARNAAATTEARVRRIARAAVDVCALRGSVAFARRECMGGMHNRIMQDVNYEYWDVVKPGS